MTELHCWHNDNVLCVDCDNAKFIYFTDGNVYFNININTKLKKIGELGPERDYTVRGQSNVWRIPK
jgi:hypothetical protein